MPVNPGMLLGMIKQLDKRIKALEIEREKQIPPEKVRDNRGTV